MLQPSVVYTETKPPSLKSLITDPYIVLAAGRKNPLSNIKYTDILNKEIYNYRCCRRNNVCKYGYCYVGTESTNMDDGHDGREPLETGSYVFTSEH